MDKGDRLVYFKKIYIWLNSRKLLFLDNFLGNVQFYNFDKNDIKINFM